MSLDERRGEGGEPWRRMWSCEPWWRGGMVRWGGDEEAAKSLQAKPIHCQAVSARWQLVRVHHQVHQVSVAGVCARECVRVRVRACMQAMPVSARARDRRCWH